MHHDSPRIRRLRNDLTALDRIRSESSVFDFQSSGSPPHQYQIVFKGKGLWRDRGKVKLIQTHRVEIKLGSSYPRTIPEIRWLTPIYHPNISEIGMVCLGGYGTHWAPSVQLDELCLMLWDMARYHNYDVRSPYNRDAALWVANQTAILFPTDPRSIRDLRAAKGRLDAEASAAAPTPNPDARPKPTWRLLAGGSDRPKPVAWVRQFIERYGRPPIIDDENDDDDGMLILESTDTSTEAEARAPEPTRGEDEVLFIE
jgi:ubiquitin-protein ligase